MTTVERELINHVRDVVQRHENTTVTTDSLDDFACAFFLFNEDFFRHDHLGNNDASQMVQDWLETPFPASHLNH